jgi:DNA polymerase-3 subunit delta'
MARKAAPQHTQASAPAPVVAGGLEAVVGHPAAVAQMLAWCAGGEPPHAVLLIGPEGVGKTALALRFASQLLGAGSWPGGVAAHPDCFIDDSDESSIGIDQVRGTDESPGLRTLFGERPFTPGFRVAVLARAERLTEAAANALLKVLEEPPEQSVILLCATAAERLPATIRSRCQGIQLGSVPVPAVSHWLTEQGVATESAQLCAAVSGGRPGRALRLARDASQLSEEMGWVSAFLGAGRNGAEGALRAARQVAPASSGAGFVTAREQVAVWTQVMRDVACVQSGVADLVTWTPFAPAIQEWAERLSVSQVMEALRALAKLGDELSRNAMPLLAYEVLFLRFFGGSHAMPTPSPELCQPQLGAFQPAGRGLG